MSPPNNPMPLKTESIDEPILNLTPMIDIVFLLLIFFMVGTQFAREEPTMFDIELATTSSAASITPGPDPLVISIDNDGTIRLNKQAMSLDELKGSLIRAKENFEEQAVIIGGAGGADLQHVFDVLDVCKELELKRFTLAATQRP